MNKISVYFIGAGPGDPELLTIKAKKIIDNADLIIYAGSLVNPDIFWQVKNDAVIYDSSRMTLEEVMDLMIAAAGRGDTVARVHTGDPSIYGAIREQIDILEDKGISCQVIPGVSSFTAAAAALKREFTLPGVSQTVILTRISGRTIVPDSEDLDQLARHRASMALFLSVADIKSVCAKLMHYYSATTSVAVVYKASWPQQLIIRGNLSDISEKVEQAGVVKTAQILIGDFLGDEYQLSRLYHKDFSHEYRKAEDE